MSAELLRLAVAQITSTDQVDLNLALVEKLYAQGAAERADLVVFPENSLFFRIRSGETLRGLEWNGPEIKRLQKLVDQCGPSLIVTTAIAEPGGKLSNSTLLLQKERTPAKLYSKVHLFDVDVAGAPPVRESEYFTGGSETRLIDIKGWKIGLSICYDLRFAELYLKYAL